MKVMENISYSAEYDPYTKGDLYIPENTDINTIPVLCIHGGSWNSLDKSRMKDIAGALCRKGNAIVYNINYRLCGEYPWPACIEDCLSAARFLLYGNILPEEVGKKPLFILGASSGGHLALMTGLLLHPEEVCGIISISGINSVKEDHAFAPGRYKGLFGHEAEQGELDQADPVKFLTENAPPILCTHERSDNVVPVQCTENFISEAEKKGVRVSSYLYCREEEGFSHRIFIPGSTRLYTDIEEVIVQWIKNMEKERRMESMDYIPEPVPVKSDIEISAFYYPGTEQMAEWDQLEQTRPELKPLLGWYDERNPEVIDWQIKWAVEHGISSFCVDWYWNKGTQRLDHWVKGFYKAKFRKYLKWYLMWANHNETGSHSEEDQRRVTRFWIENYFRTPEYYTIGGHPVVVMWSIFTIDRDFRLEAEKKGEKLAEGEGVKRALEISNNEMRKAGLPDIHFICIYQGADHSPEQFAAAKNAGFREMMNYNMLLQVLSQSPEEIKKEKRANWYHFDHVLASSPKWWALTASGKHEFSIVPTICTGWDDRPRSFEKGRVLYDRTAEKFKALCLACKEFCEKNGRKRVILSPVNEWQEGSYIEPNEEYGFSMYDALRDVFCKKPANGFPPDLIPEDVKRGPYDFPPMEHFEKTVWDFTEDMQGWYRQPFGTAHLQIVDSSLHFFRSGGDHAAIRTRIKPFPAEKFSRFKVVMKVTPPEEVDPQKNETQYVRLFFGTTSRPLFSGTLQICREGAVAVPAVTDGQWQEYILDMASNPLWQGMINELWFDPPQKHSTYIDIRRMEFLP